MGVKRTSPSALHMSAYDPKRTCDQFHIGLRVHFDCEARKLYTRSRMEGGDVSPLCALPSHIDSVPTNKEAPDGHQDRVTGA